MSDSAVELLNAALAGRDRVERFVQEIRTTAALSHPHILPLFDSGTGSRPPWRPRGWALGGGGSGDVSNDAVTAFVLASESTTHSS